MGKTINYADGVSITVMRKICKFWFRDNFISIDKDNQNYEFLLILKESAKEKRTKMGCPDYFEKHFNMSKTIRISYAK